MGSTLYDTLEKVINGEKLEEHETHALSRVQQLFKAHAIYTADNLYRILRHSHKYSILIDCLKDIQLQLSGREY